MTLAILTEQDWAAFAHIIKQSVYGDGWSSFSVVHPPTCAPREDGWCAFTDVLCTGGRIRSLPRRLGVFAATVEDGKPQFVFLRELTQEDPHG